MRTLSVSKLNNIRNVLQWRWWLIARTALLIVLIETVEHNWLEARAQTSDNYVLIEIVQYGTIFIIAEGVILTLVDRASAKSLENAVWKERQSIAREIHDSLGENISYLHLKLEYLASTQTLDLEMQRELEQAQQVAE